MNQRTYTRQKRSRKANGARRRFKTRGQTFKNMGSSNVNSINIFRNYQPSHVVSPHSLGFPDEMDLTLVYSNDLNMQSSVGEQQMIYEGNNPWDPDPQLGGRSASEYHTLMRVYRYCRVYGSAIEVNYNVINGDGFQCTVAPLAEPSAISYEMLMCLPRSKTGRIVTSQGVSSSLIVNDANTAALYGIKNLDWDISNQFSLINTSDTAATEPTRKWYWHVAFQNNAGQNSLNGTAKVRIFYRCHFYGRKFPTVLTSVTSDGDDAIPTLEPSLETTILDPVTLGAQILDIEDSNLSLPLNVGQFISRPKTPIKKFIIEGDDLTAFLETNNLQVQK